MDTDTDAFEASGAAALTVKEMERVLFRRYASDMPLAVTRIVAS